MTGRLGGQIMCIVRRDTGVRLAELCEETGATLSETRGTCWALVNSGRLDFCAGWFVLRPAPVQVTRRAA